MQSAVVAMALAGSVMVQADSAAAGPRVLFVDDDAPPGGDGAAWATALRFLQDAMTLAADPRRGVSEIRVAQGTYQPDRDEVTTNGSGDRKDSFALVDGVALRGGYAGLRGTTPEERDIERFASLLSGEIDPFQPIPPLSSDCFSPHEGPGCDNAACMEVVCQLYAPYCCSPLFSWDLLCSQLASLYCQQKPQPTTIHYGSDHVVTGVRVGRATVLDGFIITCRDFGPALPAVDRIGRGVYLFDSSPQIIRCQFVDNVAYSDATHNGVGAALASIQSNPVIVECGFKDNRASNQGGAIWNEVSSPVITQCSFKNNFASDQGGAIWNEDSSPIIDNCMFVLNRSDLEGGAIYNSRGSPVILNSHFSMNQADGWGGVMRNSHSDVRLSNCVLEGSTDDDSSEGGGIYQIGATLTLEDCVFNGLVARGTGGAIRCIGSDRVSALRCVFDSNLAGRYSSSSSYGGAVSVSGTGSCSFEQCVFRGNLSEYVSGSAQSNGGAFYAGNTSDLAFRDCVFEDNHAWNYAGAVLLYDTTATMSQCKFIANTVAFQVGGAVYCHDGQLIVSDSEFQKNTANLVGGALVGNGTDIQLSSCRFIGNRTMLRSTLTGVGGAVFGFHNAHFAALNCVFVGNAASGPAGGAFYLWDGCLVELVQCTLAFNSASSAGGGVCIWNAGTKFLTPKPSHASIINCILWNNTDSLGSIEQSQLAVVGPDEDAFDVNHSCIQGWTGSLGGVGNIGDDPLFIDPLGLDGEPGGSDADLRLAPRSPCIDTGDTSAVCGAILSDLDGAPRIADGDRDQVFIVDMGAYEAPGPALPASDLNCDGVIDSLDLGILLSSWSISPESPGCGGSVPCAADLNHDGDVDTMDLGILLAGWTL